MIKNLIISILPVLLVGVVIPYNESIYFYVWFLPIPLFIFFQLFFPLKYEYDKGLDIKLGTILKSKLIDLFLYIIYFGVCYVIFNFFPKIRSLNFFYLFLYMFINKNIFRQSLGAKIVKIKIENERLIDKIKILVNNFLIISPIYVMLLKYRIQMLESIEKALVEFLLLVNLINIFTRLFVLKKKSIFEEILKLNYFVVKTK